jgi:hypothetical protein
VLGSCVQQQVQDLASGTTCHAPDLASSAAPVAGPSGADPTVHPSTMDATTPCADGAAADPPQALLPDVDPVLRQDHVDLTSSGTSNVLRPAHGAGSSSTPAASIAPSSAALPPSRRQPPASSLEVLPHRTRLQGGMRQPKKVH